nr:MAG TPA: hypothetical protein [Caudoviricetes sp.]
MEMVKLIYCDTLNIFLMKYSKSVMLKLHIGEQMSISMI